MADALVIDVPATTALSAALEVKAELYLDARRRVGQGTLDAARAVAEARSQARHGEWGPWLQRIGLSPDGAERLQAIHQQALTDPTFAERVRTGFLGLTVAGEIARSPEPEALLQRLLAVELPPTLATVRATKQLVAPNPAAPREMEEAPDPFDELRRAIIVGPARWHNATQLIAQIEDEADQAAWGHDLAQVRQLDQDLRGRHINRIDRLLGSINDAELCTRMRGIIEVTCQQLGLNWPPKPAEPAPALPDGWQWRTRGDGQFQAQQVGGAGLTACYPSNAAHLAVEEARRLALRATPEAATVSPASIEASLRSCLARLDTHGAQPLLYGLSDAKLRGRWTHTYDRVKELAAALHQQVFVAARTIVESINDPELRAALLAHVGIEEARAHLVEQAKQAGYTLTFTPDGAARFVDAATGALAGVAADLSMVEAKLNGLTSERTDPNAPRPNPAPADAYADLERRAQQAGTSIRWVGFAGANAPESHFEVYEPSTKKVSRYPARTVEAGPTAWLAALGRVEAIIGQRQEQQPAPAPLTSAPADDEARYVEVCDEDEGGEEVSLIRVRLGRNPLVAEALAAIGEAVYRLDVGEAHAIDDGLLSELRGALAAGGLKPGMAMLLDTVIDAVLGAVDDALGTTPPPPPLPLGAEADDPPALKLLLARLADGERSTVPLARRNLARSCERDLTALAEDLDDDRYAAIAARIRALAPPKPE